MTEFKIALKRTAAVFAAVGVLTSAAYADVLGTHISAEQERIAPYTDYHKNVFNDSDVGHQTEHYVEYKPNGVVRPIVANGWSAYGKRTVLQAADVLRDMGYNPAVGMNADFFSFQTGCPDEQHRDKRQDFHRGFIMDAGNRFSFGRNGVLCNLSHTHDNYTAERQRF